MNYSEVLRLTFGDIAPKGWKQELSFDEYEQLDNESKKRYGFRYAKYRTKKYRDYDECGKFTGWMPMQVGVGKPIGYKYHGVITAHYVDSVMNSNVLMGRITKSKWDKKVN